MATVEITNYYARWSPTRHNGYIMLYWNTGFRTFPEFSNPTEFQVLVDLLRNEKPVWWDDVGERLYANNEPVGEGE